MAHSDRGPSRRYLAVLARLTGRHLRAAAGRAGRSRTASLGAGVRVCTTPRPRARTLRGRFPPDRTWHHQVWADGAPRAWVESRLRGRRPRVSAVGEGPLAASMDETFRRLDARASDPLVRLLRLRHPRVTALLVLDRQPSRDEVVVLESRARELAAGRSYGGAEFLEALGRMDVMLGMEKARR
jgi:hypothetical protein